MAIREVVTQGKKAVSGLSGRWVRRKAGGQEGLVYTNGKYAFKIVIPTTVNNNPPAVDALRKHGQLSAAEQVARHLRIFAQDHPNVAKAHFILPFTVEEDGIRKPCLFVIQDWIKPNCKQPVMHPGLHPDEFVGKPLVIDPKLQKMCDDLIPKIVSINGKKDLRNPNVIRRADSDRTRDMIVDCTLKPEVLPGGTAEERSINGELAGAAEFRPQVREACQKTGKCYCYWPDFVKKAKGFGKIPDDLKESHFRQIPEIAPLMPWIVKHLAERDAKKGK